MPLPRSTCNSRDYNEYWAKKDDEILNLVKDAYNAILHMKKPTRITTSLIGRFILKKALLEKN